MNTLAALDISFVVRELKELEQSIVDKIFQPEKRDIILQLHKAGAGKKLLKLVAGKGIYLTKEKPIGDSISKPSPFCMLLRKQLKQTRVVSIKQPGLERITEIQFSNGAKLIVEAFGKGNTILCDKDNKIIAAIEKQEWKHRSVKKGNTYNYPPASKDPFIMTEEEFTEKYKKSNKENAVKILALDFALGGKYAEEICLKAKIDKKKKRIDISKVVKELRKLKSSPLKPQLIKDTNEFSPIELEVYKGAEKQKFKSCSEALEEWFKTFSEDTLTEKGEKQRLANLAEKQKQQIENLKKKGEEYKKVGDLIYVHYTEIEKIIKEIKAKNWQVKHPLLKEIKKKERKIILEL